MTEKQNMRAVAITAFGGPDRLMLMQMPRPIPGPDEVLIRVQSAGVGVWDVKVRRGQIEERSFPYILGWESASIIEQTGANVIGFREGDAVYCYVQHVGHYAEYIVVPAALIAKRPGSFDGIHAAAIPVNGLTAHQSLTDKLALRAGETVLITAAAGGTGSFAVQIAAHLGAHVIATASAHNHAYLDELGASEIIDHATTVFRDTASISSPRGTVRCMPICRLNSSKPMSPHQAVEAMG